MVFKSIDIQRDINSHIISVYSGLMVSTRIPTLTFCKKIVTIEIHCGNGWIVFPFIGLKYDMWQKSNDTDMGHP